jgi:hypothetical protein
VLDAVGASAFLAEARRIGTTNVCSSCGMPTATRDRRKRDIEPATSHVTGPAQAPIAVCGYPAAAELVDAIHASPLATTRLGCGNGLRQAAQALLASQDWPPCQEGGHR